MSCQNKRNFLKMEGKQQRIATYPSTSNDEFRNKTYPRPMQWGVWSKFDDLWYTQLQRHYDAQNNQDRLEQRETIPKIIHQIWLGSEIPVIFKKWMKSWKLHHPEWEYRLWTDETLSRIPLQNQEAFDQALNFGEKSDILRYEILYQQGGLYVDVDFECLKPLDPLIQNKELVCGVSNTGTVEINNALIASVPHHPILYEVMQRISRATAVSSTRNRNRISVQRMTKAANTISEMLGAANFDSMMLFQQQKHNTLQITGPGLFTQVFMQAIGEIPRENIGKTTGEKCSGFLDDHQRHGVIAYPNMYFYPIPNTAKLESESDKKKTYDGESISFAVHYWACSWQGST